MANKRTFLLYSNQPEQFNSFISFINANGWQTVQIAGVKLLQDYTLEQDDGILYCLGIFDPISCSFSADELEQLTIFCRAGNSMIIAGGQNEDRGNKVILNEITARFGVTFNEDCVVRPNLYKHYHPKEAQLRDFIVNRGFTDTLKKHWKDQRTNDDLMARDNIGVVMSGPHLLYPYGCSLKVGKACTILMTSSQWAIPCKQAICALYGNGIRGNNMRVIVIGSASMMNNKYIDKEDNKAIIETLLEYIVNKNSPINVSDAKTVEIPEVIWGPDIESLIDVPLSCIQESEQLPSDRMSLIDNRLFNIDSSRLPSIVGAYQDLNLPHEPLTLIKPELRFRSLKLEPATHGFLLRR